MAKPEPKQRGAGTNFIPPPPINLADRPFVCDYPGCRWSFKRQYHLDRHYMTHRLPLSKDSEHSSENQMHPDTDSDGEPLSSPSIVTSSKSDHLNSSESRSGTSLLSPLPVKSEVASPTVPTKFAWPQLVKDKLVNCPACDFRFKNREMAEQHFSMAHAGSSAASLQMLDLKALQATTLKDSKTLKSNSGASNELAALGLGLGKPRAASTPDTSLLKKPRENIWLQASAAEEVQQQTLHFTQLKLLQALTGKGNANAAATAALLAAAAAATTNASDSGVIAYEDEEYDQEDEKDLLFRNWMGKQNQQQRKPSKQRH